mgnify:CR=1 FL=1
MGLARAHYQGILILLGILLPGILSAQELEPRSYNNLPVDLTFVGMGVIRSEGDLSPTPSSPLQDAELTIDVAALSMSRTFAIAEASSKLDVIVGRTCYEGSASFRGEYVDGRRCEYLDPKVKLTWNFYGAPAMGLKEIRQWKQDVVVGASVLASIPVGTYDPDHIINAGANRWMIQPAIGMSKRMQGWQWEAKASVSFFEDNDDFFGGIKSEQDPLYAVSAHLIYLLKRGSWISLDGNYFAGGRSKKNGVRQDDRQENSRWGFSWSKPLSPKLIIKIYGSTGVVTRIGNDFDNYGLGVVYRI